MSKYIDMKVKSWEEEGADEGVFIGLANKRWFKDHVGDVTTNSAFTKSIQSHKAKSTMPKLLLQHKTEQVVGVFLDIWEDEEGMWCKGQLCLDTTLGRETYALMKQGALDALSIGYVTLKEHYDHATKTNFLDEVDVKEISIVTWGCNSESKIVDVKSEEVEIEQSEATQPEEINTVVEQEQAEVIEEVQQEQKEVIAPETLQKLDHLIMSFKLDSFLATLK